MIWSPEKIKKNRNAPLFVPVQPCHLNSFDEDQIMAFSERQAFECFGKGFERCASHTKPGNSQWAYASLTECMLARAREWTLASGWNDSRTGYSPDSWFLRGTKDDPCMPGTLMLDGCFQAMGFYMAWLGLTKTGMAGDFNLPAGRSFA